MPRLQANKRADSVCFHNKADDRESDRARESGVCVIVPGDSAPIYVGRLKLPPLITFKRDHFPTAISKDAERSSVAQVA
ncbi:hypothetical protein EVAR_32663_1 [Eumeta japonica]|uniref:Uncharacterized protein n=1 Tax=Eumeta variegata TaxID=151549 RepID=A0A4C1WS49_EUMVA|nr:hypothetical protein EVAR_32663_1 [Eumeta japonica]